MSKLQAIHPGEILAEGFMGPRGLTANKLALELHIPANRLTEIIRGRRAITADTALRLGRYFKASPEMWLGLQADYELRKAKAEIGKRIVRARSSGESATLTNRVIHRACKNIEEALRNQGFFSFERSTRDDGKRPKTTLFGVKTVSDFERHITPVALRHGERLPEAALLGSYAASPNRNRPRTCNRGDSRSGIRGATIETWLS